MGNSLKRDETVREYLLGRVSDEAVLERLEDMLFNDEEFCAKVALVEDGIINDYVLGRLDDDDANSFRATLAANSERRFKLEMTRALREKALASSAPAKHNASLLASIAALLRQPVYAGALGVALIAAVSLALYFRLAPTDPLSGLRSMYQRERPVETRISTFGYAPLSTVRGALEPNDQRKLRRFEISLIDAAEKNPSGQTHHALGVFYLTQKEYETAIREFESALKFDPENAKIHNDLGSAYLELGQNEKSFEQLARGLEEFTKATELEGNLLEALFNKSLALQKMSLPRQAKESWTLYLAKDASSPWAEEARKHLAELENQQSLFKPDAQVLTDFLTAYRKHDDAHAHRIHNDTKGLLQTPAVAQQLTRRFLLARQRGDDAEARESVEALSFIGEYERAENDDLFFAHLANFYSSAAADKIGPLLRATEAVASSMQIIGKDYSRGILQFENSSTMFAKLGDTCEAELAKNVAAQYMPDTARLAAGRQRLEAAIASAESRKFIVLLAPAYYWLGINDALQNKLSQSNRNLKTALRLAGASHNTFETQHALEALTLNYSTLGELETALCSASRLLNDTELYYQRQSQSLRNKGTLADLSLRMSLSSVSLSFSTEKLQLTQEIAPGSVNDALRYMVIAALAKKDFSAALQYAGDSMQIADKAGDSPENTRTRALICGLLGDVKSQTKDYSGALADYDRALEEYRRIPELSVDLYQIHKGRLFSLQCLNDVAGFAGELRTVLDLSEEYRRTIREDSSRQAFFANEQSVFDAATESALRQREVERAFGFAEDSKARSLLEFVQSGKSIAEVEADFGSVARPLSLNEIQSRLPEQVQVLEYAALPDKLAIWLITRSQFELIEKQITAAELEDKVDTYCSLIRGKSASADLSRVGQELYDILIPQGLNRGKQLCLVADKSLHQLSFAALISPDGKYLLEEYSLLCAPSASVLVLATENARAKERVSDEKLLSIGNPYFDREENPKLPDLPDAEAEARAVAEDYRNSLPLLGAGATKTRFLASLTDREVIHFAGHFVSNRQSPGVSKLLFAGGEVRSSELGGFKLPKAKLVILSACRTSYERYNKSEGAIGIARTLLALGAPLVVASQWQVDSAMTKDLMIAFHHNRKQKGMTSAESLRQAQLAVLGAESTNAPYYWAAFSLFGGYANY